MSAFVEQEVLSVQHWTDRLFSFRTTRNAGLRFGNGQFTMIGLRKDDGRPLLRAYSFVSPNHEPHLEFLSIKVPGGELTTSLQKLRPGDAVVVGRKPTGTLRIANLIPARNLYLFATGTGLAPFMSVIRDPETYEKFDKVILVHGVRRVSELAYREHITRELPRHDVLGDVVRRQLVYLPTVTREPFARGARITHLVDSGELARELAMPDLAPAIDRVMICGSPAMLRDLSRLCEGRGFAEGNSGQPGHFIVERAFAES